MFEDNARQLGAGTVESVSVPVITAPADYPHPPPGSRKTLLVAALFVVVAGIFATVSLTVYILWENRGKQATEPPTPPVLEAQETETPTPPVREPLGIDPALILNTKPIDWSIPPETLECNFKNRYGQRCEFNWDKLHSEVEVNNCDYTFGPVTSEAEAKKFADILVNDNTDLIKGHLTDLKMVPWDYSYSVSTSSWVINYDYTYHGHEVEWVSVSVNIDRATGQLTYLSSNIYRIPETMPWEAKISEAQAITLSGAAKEEIKEIQLMIARVKKAPHFTWRLHLYGGDYGYIDAITGEVLHWTLPLIN
jgi:hypothetical protein